MDYTAKINFINELQQLEEWQRHGRTDLVVQKIKQISRFKIPREFLGSFSEFAYRANLFSTALLFLNKVVRTDHFYLEKPSAKEKLFYAASLVGIGATDEAIGLFNEINSSDEPEVLLYHSFALFSQWKYRQAIPFLKKFIAWSTPISDYRRLVGKINLAAAYIVERQYTHASLLINDCLLTTEREKLHLLHGNCLELQSQIANSQGEYAQAEYYLVKAQKYLNQHHGRYHFFLDKGLILTELLKSKGSQSSLQQLDHLKKKAYENKRWETLRDCDLYEAMFTRDEDLIAKLYRGTPYKGYHLRMKNMLQMNEFDFSHNIELAFDQNFFSNQTVSLSHPSFQSANGELTLGSEIFCQKSEKNDEKFLIFHSKKLENFFKSLFSDFYKPMSLGALFSSVYPEEYYNIRSSPSRIFSAIKRLNYCLQQALVPLRVESERGYFLIKSDRPTKLIFNKSVTRKKSVHYGSIEKIHDLYGTRHFTVQSLTQDLCLSKTSVNQIVQFGLLKNIFKKNGNGRSTTYRFCRKTKAA